MDKNSGHLWYPHCLLGSLDLVHSKVGTKRVWLRGGLSMFMSGYAVHSRLVQLLGGVLLSLQSWFQNVTYRHLALSLSHWTAWVSVVWRSLSLREDPVPNRFLGPILQGAC